MPPLSVHLSSGGSSAWGKINRGRHRREHRHRRANQFPALESTLDPSVFLTLQNQLFPIQRNPFRQPTPKISAQTFPVSQPSRRSSVNEGLPLALAQCCAVNRKIRALPTLHSVHNPHRMLNPHTMAQNLRYPGRPRLADKLRMPRIQPQSSCTYTTLDVPLNGAPPVQSAVNLVSLPASSESLRPPAEMDNGNLQHSLMQKCRAMPDAEIAQWVRAQPKADGSDLGGLTQETTAEVRRDLPSESASDAEIVDWFRAQEARKEARKEADATKEAG